MSYVQQIDEEILQEVVNMRFDRNQLVESLQNRTQNDGTVAYYLVSDNRFKQPCCYAGATVEVSKSWSADQKPPSEVSIPAMAHHRHLTTVFDCQDKSLKLSFPTEKWALGIQSGAHPREIMSSVLKALKELNIYWKKIGHYNIKCRWIYRNICNQSSHNYLRNGSTSNEIGDAPTIIKFEIQLFESHEGKNVLDLQNVQGPQFLFMDLCSALFAQL